MSSPAVARLDLTPSVDLRLQLAEGLYLELVTQLASQDYNLWADACRRADLVMYGDAQDAYPRSIRITAWQLYEWLRAHTT